MARPRGLDMDLVQAQQARRALDYLVGYGLSPLMWRKAPGCRSAGRVQSVALRLVCAREAEIEAFVAQEYWTVEAVVATEDGARFAAGLDRLDGAPVDGRGLATRETAEAAARRIRDGAFAAVSVERRTVRPRPAPPFTTAALQQEAARRFGFGVGYTMRIAQALYEGIDLDGGRAGLITYMRTDGVAVAKAAVDEARRTVRREHGGGYLSRAPRAFRSRAVNVHEAHEAIRPTEAARTPESLAGAARAGRGAALRADPRPDAGEPDGGGALGEAGDRAGDAGRRGRAGGRRRAPRLRRFPESLRLRRIREIAADGTPPALDPGERVRIEEVRVARRLTAAPPRYTEAGLVGRLEALGIGRPSTWAVIVGVLRERGYAAIEGGCFAPLERGRVATAFLEEFFGRWVEYGFTAAMEEELDRIAGGEAAWKSVLGGFWGCVQRRPRGDRRARSRHGSRRGRGAPGGLHLRRGRGAGAAALPGLRRGRSPGQGEPARPVRGLRGVAGLRLPPAACGRIGRGGPCGAEAARDRSGVRAGGDAAARPARALHPAGRRRGGEAPAHVGAGRHGSGRDRARGRAEAARAAARGGRPPCKRAADPGRHRPLRSLGAARRDLRGDNRGRGRARRSG